MKRVAAALLFAAAVSFGAQAGEEACGPELSEAAEIAQAPAAAKARYGRLHTRRADRSAHGALAVIGGRVQTIDAGRMIDRSFTVFDPDYASARASRRVRLDALKAKLDAAQRPGHWLYCSQELYNDAEWRIEYTALWPAADRALDALEASLSDPDQANAARQAQDGSFGGCRPEFIFRLDRTVSAFDAMGPETPERLGHPLTFLSPLRDLNGTGHLLFSRAVSAIAETGVYSREEQSSLNESLPQLLFKPALRARAEANGAAFLTDSYRDRYRDLLDAMQDRTTGFWGPALMTGRQWIFLPDLSMTYHIAAYRHGCVKDWDRLLKALLAMERTDYPYGWRSEGRVTPHNAYDVVRLFRLGWPHASQAQRQAARAAIRRMVRSVLQRDIAPDGRVRFDPAYYETEAAAYYFAIAFLDVAGYWQKDRFWTRDRTVAPGSAALCHGLKARVAGLSGESPLATGAMARLRTLCP